MITDVSHSGIIKGTICLNFCKPQSILRSRSPNRALKWEELVRTQSRTSASWLKPASPEVGSQQSVSPGCAVCIVSGSAEEPLQVPTQDVYHPVGESPQWKENSHVKACQPRVSGLWWFWEVWISEHWPVREHVDHSVYQFIPWTRSSHYSVLDCAKPGTEKSAAGL